MMNGITFKELAANGPALTASILLVLLVLTAAIGPCLVPYDPFSMDLDSLKQPPGKAHLLGTDSKGRDILSRVVSGSRISLTVGITASALSLCIGIFFGLIAGYFGGSADAALSQFFDIFLAFPSLLLAIGISAVMPPGLASAMLAITLVGWAGFARLVRGITLSIKDPVPAYPAQCAPPASRGRQSAGRRIHPARSGSFVSRPRRAASGADLGLHDQPEQGLHQFCSVDGYFPGPCNQYHGYQLQYTRRFLERQARPEDAGIKSVHGK
jgi:hypothetical protein